MADGSGVRVLQKAMVLPRQPPALAHPGHLFLSCFDLFWQDIHYNQRLIFYERTLHLPAHHGHAPPETHDSNPSPPAATLMAHLRSSLALCLAHYYPWCGRLARGVLPPHRLFIDCSDLPGVEFVEASSPLPLSHFARDRFQMKPFFQQLCQKPDHQGDCLFSSPLLSVQATLFSDGGLVVGIAHSHVVADGKSLWDFMVSWGECSRGLPLSAPPLHNREMLAVVDPSPEKATWSLNSQTKEEDKEEQEKHSGEGNPLIQNDAEDNISSARADSTINKYEHSSVEVDHKMYAEKKRVAAVNKNSMDSNVGMIRVNDSDARTDASANEDNALCVEIDGAQESSAASGASSVAGGYKTEPLVQCMFDFPASAIKKLKSEAGGGHTSFECISAHFWKLLAAAREDAASAPTFFFSPVNCRTCVTPPLSSSYFGNVAAFDAILSTVGAIQRETLCATACRIRNLVSRVKAEDYVVALMHWLETHNYRLLDKVFATTLGKSVGTASSPWFPAYQVDYGWGKPVAVRSANVPGEGELVLFGGRPGSMPGDVEICTALSESVLKRLVDNPVFLARPPSSPLPDH